MKLPKIKIDTSDIAVVAGLVSLFSGLWMYQLRIALVTVGALLFAYGIASDFLAGILKGPRTGKGKKGPG